MPKPGKTPASSWTPAAATQTTTTNHPLLQSRPLPDKWLPRHADRPPPPPPESKRGLVQSFSEKSRRRFLRTLCTIRRDAVPHTMALTLPDEWQQFDHDFLHNAFKKLGQRFCAKVERSPAWANIALAWKKELQKRGALHWHLLFYGIGENAKLAADLQRWFDDQWNELICAKLSESERLKHAVWHHHAHNWQQVERIEYFSKYVGKASGLTDEQCSTGRWWGFWRKEAIPWADEQRDVIDERVAVDLNRIARKIRQKRADAAKHAALAALMKFNTSPFQPFITSPQPVTLWDMQKLRAGYGPDGKRDPHAAFWLRFLTEAQKQAGVRFGRYRFKYESGAPDPDSCTICLTGKHIPATLQRALDWSRQRHGLTEVYVTLRRPTPENSLVSS